MLKQDFFKGIAAGIVITGVVGGAFFWGYHLNSKDEPIKIESSSETASKSITSEEKSTISGKSKEDSIQEDSFNISFGPDHSTLKLKTNDGETKTFDNMINRMIPFDYSPSGKKVLLTPGMEELGDYLYIYTPNDGLEEIINTEDGSKYMVTPSGAVWLDERYILILQGNRHGHGIAGSLEVYDTESKELKPIHLFEGAVTNISIVSPGDSPIVVISGIQFTDDIQNENVPYVEFHKIEDVIKMIQSM